MHRLDLLQKILGMFPDATVTPEPTERIRKYKVTFPPGERHDAYDQVVAAYGDQVAGPGSGSVSLRFDNGLGIEFKDERVAKIHGAAPTAWEETATLVAMLLLVEGGREASQEELEEVYLEIPQRKVTSALFSAEALKAWLGSDRGFTWHHEVSGTYVYKDGSAIQISSVPNVHQHLTKAGARFGLEAGFSNANIWNPSDIALVRKGKEQEVCDRLDQSTTLAEANAYLKEALLARDFVGVSLKQIAKYVPPKEVNMAEKLETKPQAALSRVRMPFATPFEGRSTYAYFTYAGNEGLPLMDLILTLKNFGGKKLQAEITPQRAKARWGKIGVAALQRTLIDFDETWRRWQDIDEAMATADQAFIADVVQEAVGVLEQLGERCNFTAADVQHFCDQAIEQWSDSSIRIVVFNLLQALKFLAVIAHAEREGTLGDIIHTWALSSQKATENAAPFLKIGESVKKHLQETATGKNLHMTHVDELPILSGREGAEVAIEAMSKAFQKLSTKATYSINVKMDGSPAAFIGWVKAADVGVESKTEKIFVMALKSLFVAKNPKIITQPHDIDVYYGDKPDLAYKLHTLWKVFKGHENFVPKDQIWQGDFMYTKDELNSITLDGQEYLTFHPNTIMYAVRKDSDVGKAVSKSDVGIVWHTRYKGSSLANMRSQHDIDVDEIKDVPKLWSTTPFTDYDDEPVLGKAARTEYERLEARATVLVGKLSDEANIVYKSAIEDNKGQIGVQINAMINSMIRAEKDPCEVDASEGPTLFREYLREKTADKIARLQSKDQKTRPAEKEYERWMETLAVTDADVFNEALVVVYSLLKVLTDMKMILLRGFDEIATKGGDILTFLVKGDGDSVELEKTGSEGFVVEARGYALKIVDRLQFSKANWDPVYKKGWQK